MRMRDISRLVRKHDKSSISANQQKRLFLSSNNSRANRCAVCQETQGLVSHIIGNSGKVASDFIALCPKHETLLKETSYTKPHKPLIRAPLLQWKTDQPKYVLIKGNK